MPDIESHIDTVDGANFITVCDVQSAYWKIPTAKKGCHKTAFVTSKGKYVFKVLPSGIANAPWIFQRVMSLAFANFGQPSGLLVYMDDVIACSATCEAHPRLVGITFWSRTVMRLSNRLSPVEIRKSPPAGGLLHAGPASINKAQGSSVSPQRLPWSFQETSEEKNIVTTRQTFAKYSRSWHPKVIETESRQNLFFDPGASSGCLCGFPFWEGDARCIVGG